MATPFKRVEIFNQEILGIKPRNLGLQEFEECKLSYAQISEEADEFMTACIQQDYVKAIDACIDSIVFAKGILYKMGVDEELFHKIFAVVMDANMQKKIGIKKGREGFNAVDAVKPENWVSPESRIEELLNEKVRNS